MEITPSTLTLRLGEVVLHYFHNEKQNLSASSLCSSILKSVNVSTCLKTNLS